MVETRKHFHSTVELEEPTTTTTEKQSSASQSIGVENILTQPREKRLSKKKLKMVFFSFFRAVVGLEMGIYEVITLSSLNN